ncbi:MAG: hypothetical protein GWO26_30355, partial [Phycisphaerae bacterium]|nr:hypothetical protein [Phycisphaerae bacterium]
MRVFRTILVVTVFLLTAGFAVAETAKDSKTVEGSLGVVEFETSCSDAVAGDFNRAVALLHHMMYKQAEQV